MTLYAGGKYHLYTYKRFTDIRLVFAPEAGIAFFGGDPDNFTYPRFDLDMALFRAYEDDKAVTPARLPEVERGRRRRTARRSSSAATPARRAASQTVAQLEQLRDTVYPYVLGDLRRERALLEGRSAPGPRVRARGA